MKVTFVHVCDIPDEFLEHLENEGLGSDLADHVACAIEAKMSSMKIPYTGKDTTYLKGDEQL